MLLMRIEILLLMAEMLQFGASRNKIWAAKNAFCGLKQMLLDFGHFFIEKEYEGAFIREGMFVARNAVRKNDLGIVMSLYTDFKFKSIFNIWILL